MPKTIHFEGLPGAGKTTATKRLFRILQRHPVDASWWLEELADHPIIPHGLRAQARDPEFSKTCLDAWRLFLANDTTELVLLDGYAFQSTVRFMYAQRASMKQIASYFARWQAMAPGSLLVYLVVGDPLAHYNLVLQERSDDWREKLYAWTELTPLGRASGFQGRSGFIEFWSQYQVLCLELLQSASIEVVYIDARSADDDKLAAVAAKMITCSASATKTP